METKSSPSGAKMQSNRGEVLWRLFRPHTLTASFIPVLIGSVLAWQIRNGLNWGLVAAMLIASILIQAATNMFNEYYDFIRGLDTAESVGIAGAITRDGIKAGTVLSLALVCLLIASLLGIYICSSSSWWLALIGLGCMAVGYLYTGGPYPIAYTPFGELLAGLFMGSGIILIAYFVQTGSINWDVFLISVPNLILIGAIMMSNNIRDREGDQMNGRHTLAILLGHRRAVQFMAGMFLVANLWVVVLTLADVLPVWALLVLLSIPNALQALNGFRNKKFPAEMMPGMKSVAQTNTLFGILLTIGLLIEIGVSQL
jgi:1,4-dihydroxy-2-naphthoate octaprenyltransferase